MGRRKKREENGHKKHDETLNTADEEDGHKKHKKARKVARGKR
jgi:hypothetical protein